MSDQSGSEALPPHVQLIQMATAFWESQMVLVAAQLQLAEHLSSGARSSTELAAALRLHEPSLYRYMRALAGMGILTEVEDRHFALTTLGAALATDAPGSAHATILTLAGPIGTRSWEHLLYSLRTGKTGFERSFGKPLFDYLADNPRDASLFSKTMVGFHGSEPPAVAAAYDFNQVDSIVDVGGAVGNMLISILQTHERPRAVLFDLPHVVSDAPAFIETHELGSRISIESGDFFEAVPSGHDVYILSHIIHDWDDDQCHAILHNCRRAIARDGRLLIVEMVIPEGDAPHLGKMLDMVMLIGAGGQERTASEYAAMLSRADFRLTSIVPTDADVSIVEAIPV